MPTQLDSKMLRLARGCLRASGGVFSSSSSRGVSLLSRGGGGVLIGGGGVLSRACVSSASSLSRVCEKSSYARGSLSSGWEVPSGVSTTSYGTPLHSFSTSSSAPPSSTTTGAEELVSNEGVVPASPFDEPPEGDDLTVVSPRSPSSSASAGAASQSPAADVFHAVWTRLCKKMGGENKLIFPKNIVWLAGAPGSGKGEMTPHIAQHMGIEAAPLEVSSLLTSPEALAAKAKGKLVDDAMVLELLLETLLNDKTYAGGVIVDGFPRTRTQAECIGLLYDSMRYLRREYGAELFRRPVFHVVVLYVDESTSLKRQLARGERTRKYNERVKRTGTGTMKQVRSTDNDSELALQRYETFQKEVHDSLQVVKARFPFHFISADGTRDEVRANIDRELEYQSRLELEDTTFEMVRTLPLATEVIRHARHELVKRLDKYQRNNHALFNEVIETLRTDFFRIISRQAIAGKAVIRTENPLFKEPGAVDMALDILSERGFLVVLDVQRVIASDRLNIETGEVSHTRKTVYEFQIEFPRPTIRF